MANLSVHTGSSLFCMLCWSRIESEISCFWVIVTNPMDVRLEHAAGHMAENWAHAVKSNLSVHTELTLISENFADTYDVCNDLTREP
jgi:hypothetical protein